MGPQGSEQTIKWVSNATDDTNEEAKGHGTCLVTEGSREVQLMLR